MPRAPNPSRGGGSLCWKSVWPCGKSNGRHVVSPSPTLARTITHCKAMLVTVHLEGTSRRVDVIAEGIDVAVRARPPPPEDSDLVLRVLAEGGWRRVGVGMAAPAGRPGAAWVNRPSGRTCRR